MILAALPKETVMMIEDDDKEDNDIEDDDKEDDDIEDDDKEDEKLVRV